MRKIRGTRVKAAETNWCVYHNRGLPSYTIRSHVFLRLLYERGEHFGTVLHCERDEWIIYLGCLMTNRGVQEKGSFQSTHSFLFSLIIVVELIGKILFSV